MGLGVDVEVGLEVGTGLKVGNEMDVAVGARVGFAVLVGMTVGGTVLPGVQAPSAIANRQVNDMVRMIFVDWLMGFIVYAPWG
jgi:hypothetical protein